MLGMSWRVAGPARGVDGFRAPVVFAAWAADPTAIAFVATVAYLLVLGFLVNRYGVLTWHGMPDMYRLLVVSVSLWRSTRMNKEDVPGG